MAINSAKLPRDSVGSGWCGGPPDGKLVPNGVPVAQEGSMVHAMKVTTPCTLAMYTGHRLPLAFSNLALALGSRRLIVHALDDLRYGYFRAPSPHSSQIPGKQRRCCCELAIVSIFKGSSAIMPRAPKVRSDIWEHFEVKEDNEEVRKVECKHYGQDYNVNPKKNGTSGLRKHIKRCLACLPGIRI
uniref:BED-type domain-containing protein n=1 Tax=Nicotiana tabacum TaxID=4097 RepID=A0A1S4B1W4_TOBAC|nr:PREDICTED: uncharacterized protein LOC107803605 [Nicotiana tabacum]